MTGLAALGRRSRLGHSLFFAFTVGLLVAVVAVDPLLTRSFRSALVRYHVDSLGLASQQVGFRTSGAGVDRLPALEKDVDPRLRAVSGEPITAQSVDVLWPRFIQSETLVTTSDQCAHVHVVAGRCPRARNEVMLPEGQAKDVINPALRLGQSITVKGAYQDPYGRDLNPQKQLKFVGVFTASADDPFWGGQDIAEYDPAAPHGNWLTVPATFAGKAPTEPIPPGHMASPDVSWAGIYQTVSYPLRLSELDPTSLRDAVDGVHASTKRLGQGVDVTEALTSVYADVHVDLRQVGRILPFLLLQLGIVLLIVLAQVSGFLATVRRGEAAVLKMRGNGTSGILRLGAREFLPALVFGVVGGLALAYAVDELVRVLWLPGQVSAAWLWMPLLAAGVGALAAAIVWGACWWLMARQPISALLRSRPPRRRGARLSMPAAVLGVACLVGVVLTATKSLTGAPVQVTPVLLAGLIAIVVGVLLVPVAAWWVRRLLTRRRAAGALAVAQLGRRAGVVTALTTLIITSALFALSVSVFARGAENRAARAAADLGAAARVHASVGPGAVDGQSLIDAVNSVDPHHHVFTPSVEINATSQISNAVVGVIPSDMERIGARTGLSKNVPWAALGRGGSETAPNALVATWTTKDAVGSLVSAPTMADVDGDFRVVGSAPYIPGMAARTIVVDLATMLKAGDRQDNLSFYVLSATQNPKRLAALHTALLKQGFAATDVQTTRSVRAGYDATATAWAMNLSIVVSALSVLAALTSVVLVAVASRDDRRRDLVALRTGGVAHRVLRRATVGEFVLLALVGSVIGALTAPVAAWLTGRTMLWWSTPPDQPLTRTGFQWSVGGLAAVALAVLLVLVGAMFGMRLARAASRSEGRRSA